MACLFDSLITRSLRLRYSALPVLPSCAAQCTITSRRAPSFYCAFPSRQSHTKLAASAPWHGRGFHAGTSRLKKGGSKGSKNKSEDAGPASESGGQDPFDFSELQDAISQAHAALKDGLSKLRPGGKFNPDVVESLRISLEKGSRKTVRLGDLAQVVPRGRTLNIIAGEKEHIKAISSSVLNSDLNLTPQTDAQNPLQINIQLPPPTAESRQKTIKEAQDLADKAGTAVRNARGNQQKKLRSLTLGRAARPDDLKKAGTQMEKVVADGSAEVKKILDSSKRALESG